MDNVKCQVLSEWLELKKPFQNKEEDLVTLVE